MTSEKMWFIGISVALFGIVTALFIFLANQYLNRRTSRVGGVISDYMRIYENGGHINGLDTLFKAGVCGLKNRCEVNEVCKTIESRMKSAKTPNQNYKRETLPNKKVLPFLRYCKKYDVDLKSSVTTGIAIERFKRKIPFR